MEFIIIPSLLSRAVRMFIYFAIFATHSMQCQQLLACKRLEHFQKRPFHAKYRWLTESTDSKVILKDFIFFG